MKALIDENWTVFWDRTIPPGETWRSYIGVPLAAAPVVIVCWSIHSVESDWVGQEADAAAERKALVPVTIDPVRPPLGLAHIQAADLVTWVSSGGGRLPDLLKMGILRKLNLRPAKQEARDQAVENARQAEERGRQQAEDDDRRRLADEEARHGERMRHAEERARQQAEEEQRRKIVEEAEGQARERRRRAEDAALSEAAREVHVSPSGEILCTFALDPPGVVGFSKLALRLKALKEDGSIEDWHTHGWQDRKTQKKAIIKFDNKHDALIARLRCGMATRATDRRVSDSALATAKT